MIHRLSLLALLLALSITNSFGQKKCPANRTGRIFLSNGESAIDFCFERKDTTDNTSFNSDYYILDSKKKRHYEIAFKYDTTSGTITCSVLNLWTGYSSAQSDGLSEEK